MGTSQHSQWTTQFRPDLVSLMPTRIPSADQRLTPLRHTSSNQKTDKRTPANISVPSQSDRGRPPVPFCTPDISDASSFPSNQAKMLGSNSPLKCWLLTCCFRWLCHMCWCWCCFAAFSCRLTLTRYLQQRPAMNLHTLPTAQVGLEPNVLSQSDRGRPQSPMADATLFPSNQAKMLGSNSPLKCWHCWLVAFVGCVTCAGAGVVLLPFHVDWLWPDICSKGRPWICTRCPRPKRGWNQMCCHNLTVVGHNHLWLMFLMRPRSRQIKQRCLAAIHHWNVDCWLVAFVGCVTCAGAGVVLLPFHVDWLWPDICSKGRPWICTRCPRPKWGWNQMCCHNLTVVGHNHLWLMFLMRPRSRQIKQRCLAAINHWNVDCWLVAFVGCVTCAGAGVVLLPFHVDWLWPDICSKGRPWIRTPCPLPKWGWNQMCCHNLTVVGHNHLWLMFLMRPRSRQIKQRCLAAINDWNVDTVDLLLSWVVSHVLVLVLFCCLFM